MKITVKVTPKARVNSVEEISSNLYKVKTTAPAAGGQANEAVIKLLADYFKVKKSAVDLLQGETSRQKVIEIEL
ncbi:DUF167 domain-containing protein [Candidatus Beckwithbacteria bacterium]|nr:DUF167 domain-containing protein [Candidatus Beckwithbacteria bacterium]